MLPSLVGQWVSCRQMGTGCLRLPAAVPSIPADLGMLASPGCQPSPVGVHASPEPPMRSGVLR